MVVSGKVFKLADFLSIADAASKLENYQTKEAYDEGELHCTLISEVVNLVTKASTLSGLFSHDYIIQILHRDKIIPTPQTIKAVFRFTHDKQTVLLTVLQKKRIANFIANKLSEIIIGKVGGILEGNIAPETIKRFQLDNPEDTKITCFDNIDIPNMDKISLYGPDLTSTSLFDDYSKHGDIWYVVARAKAYGYLVGITREASVTVFNLTDPEKYLEYLENQIYSLVK
jgi:hypothetical protein